MHSLPQRRMDKKNKKKPPPLATGMYLSFDQRIQNRLLLGLSYKRLQISRLSGEERHCLKVISELPVSVALREHSQSLMNKLSKLLGLVIGCCEERFLHLVKQLVSVRQQKDGKLGCQQRPYHESTALASSR